MLDASPKATPDETKPGIHQLLIASALDPDLRRRLLESPEEVFEGFDLTNEEKQLLRHPDDRLLRALGEALSQQESASPGPTPQTAAAPQPHAVIQARTLPGMSLALTLVPCAQYENGLLASIAFAVWVNPLAEGVDPASLPPPQGAALPGQPLTPLHAIIQISAVQMQDAAGQPQVALSASLRQSTNVAAPPPPEAAGRPETAPSGSTPSLEVQAAIAAVRNAAGGERYDRLIELMRSLRAGGSQ